MLPTEVSSQYALPGFQRQAPAALSYRRPPSLLDDTVQNCTQLPSVRAYVRGAEPEWLTRLKLKRKRARAFQRAMSGLNVGFRVRLLTLTTSEESWAAGRSIQASFRALVMRLRRRRLITGYMRVLEYTKRGRPHLHLLLRGTFIPQGLISRWWMELHLSPVVDIRAVHTYGGTAGYLAKYMGKDPMARYSWSWDWVYPGFVRDWKRLVKWGYGHGLSLGYVVALWSFHVARGRMLWYGVGSVSARSP